MSVEEWVGRYAEEIGLDAPSAKEIEQVLRLAAAAAHGSQRQAAPVASWLAGKTGRPIAELADVAERLESS
ncbi:MAG TPA: DUF6457 domain-containing protein [Solirubrobacterales bacterium]|nr:DUF6457 domain-containing protein [Solirubrobacterales bacterium]